MATIYGITSLDLDKEQQEKLSQALNAELSKFFNTVLCSHLCHIDKCDCRGDAQEQITFFILLPPRLSLDDKRYVIRMLNDVMVRETGISGELKVVVIFHYHDSFTVGKDGLLLADKLGLQAE